MIGRKEYKNQFRFESLSQTVRYNDIHGKTGTLTSKALSGFYNWGRDIFTGDNIHVPVLMDLSAFTDLQEIKSEFGNSYIINDIGDLYLWGSNAHGELGFGHNNPVPTPTFNPDVNNIKKICFNEDAIYILKNDGELFVSGDNSYGDITGQTFQLVCDNIKDMFIFHNGGFLLSMQDSLFVLGDNTYGQLGVMDGEDSYLIPTLHSTNNSNIVKIDKSEKHTLLLKRNGLVYSCGYNEYNQLGYGGDVNGFEPIPNLFNIRDVSAGDGFSLFLKSYNDGEVLGCGTNEQGQLGIPLNGLVNRIDAPTKISGDKRVKKIYATNYNSYFLSVDYEIDRFYNGKNFLYVSGNAFNCNTPNHVTTPFCIRADVNVLSNLDYVNRYNNKWVIEDTYNAYSFGENVFRHIHPDIPSVDKYYELTEIYNHAEYDMKYIKTNTLNTTGMLLKDGTFHVWGFCPSYINGDNVFLSHIETIESISDIRDFYFTEYGGVVFLKNNGDVFVLGPNTNKSLGFDDETLDFNAPTKIDMLSNVDNIFTNGSLFFATTVEEIEVGEEPDVTTITERKTYSWGYDPHNLTRHIDPSIHNKTIYHNTEYSTVKEMSFNDECVMMKNYDDEFWYMGKNHTNLLGLDISLKDEVISDLTLWDVRSDIVKISLGTSHALFLTDTNEVYTCGSNIIGEAGIDNVDDHIDVLTKIPLLEKVLDVYAGHENSYFIVEDYIDIEPVWLEF